MECHPGGCVCVRRPCAASLTWRARVAVVVAVQLAKETETIGEYIILYQQHRREMSRRLQDRENQLMHLNAFLARHGFQQSTVGAERDAPLPSPLTTTRDSSGGPPTHDTPTLGTAGPARALRPLRASQVHNIDGRAAYGRRDRKTNIMTL